MRDAAQPNVQPAAGGDAAPGAGLGAGEGNEQTWDQIRDQAVADDKPEKEKTEAKPKPEQEQPAKKPTVGEWEHYKAKKAAVQKRELAVQAKEEEGRKAVEALEKRTAELEERGKLLDKLESDPKAFVEHFAKKLGMSPTKVVNVLNEYFLEQKSPAELEVAKMRKDLEERDRRDAEAKKEAEKRSASEAANSKVQAYLSAISKHVTEHEGDYTFLPTYPPDVVARAAWARIVKHHEETGQNIPLDKILEILESEEEAEYLKKEERRKRRLSGQSQEPARSGPAGKPASDEAQRPTTLNHRLAGQRTPQERGRSDQEDWETAKRQAGVSR